MKPTTTPVTFTGDERIDLTGCYVFRNDLAHSANVAIASAVSFTEDPHLFYISIAVPGSKKMTLDLGIPFQTAMKMIRYVALWNSSINEYDSCRIDVVRNLFEEHIADLTAVAWTEDAIDAVRDIQPDNEMEEAVKADLLAIAAASLEKHDV